MGLAGSEYAHIYDLQDAVPVIDISLNMANYRKLFEALQQGLVSSAHDISEGGLFVALAESMIGGQLGIDLYADYDSQSAFNEARGRIVVSVTQENQKHFEKLFGFKPIGVVEPAENGLDGIALDDIQAAWGRGF